MKTIAVKGASGELRSRLAAGAARWRQMAARARTVAA
jgi:hypothetical protein